MAAPERTSAHRASRWEEGLHLARFWLPDVRSEAFREATARAASAVISSPTAEEDMAFVEAIADGRDD